MEIEWKEIKKMITESKNKIKLECSNEENELTLTKLNINKESALGQMVLNLSALKINDYLRVLGGGNDSINSITSSNEIIRKFYNENKLIIANDIFGGLYALSNRHFDGVADNVWYFAPDLLEWENLKITYIQFIGWVCSKNLEKFYKSFLWKDMDLFIKDIKGNQGVLVYPFLWSKECNIETADKKIVLFEELITLNADYKKKLNS